LSLIPVLLLGVILPTAMAHAAGAPSAEGWSLHAGGSVALATPSWTGTTAFTEFAEPGTIDTERTPRAGSSFEAGLWHGMTRHLGIALTVTRAQRDAEGTFEASLPHPLYVGRPRIATGTMDGTQRETAVHFGLVWSVARGGVTARLSGGPSYFLAEADLVEGVTYTHEYPYDTVQVTGVRSAPVRGDAVGGHAGLSLERRLGKRLALDIGARWSRATIALDRRAEGDAGERSARVRAGGLVAGAAIRLYF
jgi:hypothetical protein